ncbi:hypothetical protein ACF1B0_23895 [Streptomyces anandii]|uniref:hypothetical protein n=1 Tax=Streptomyces anandii TaxID=285454 RepID=UPI003700A8B5
MPSRTQVQRLLADGLDHAEAVRRLGVPAGQSFLIATEERHLWPAVREALDEGDRLAGEALEQEREGAGTLAALRGATPGRSSTDWWSDRSRSCASTWRSRMPCSPGCGRIFRGRTASGRAPWSSRPGGPHRPGPTRTGRSTRPPRWPRPAPRPR